MSTEQNKVVERSTHGRPSRSGQTTPELKEGNVLNVMANVNRMLKAAGALAFIAAAQWVLLVIVAETQYPNYNTQQNYLSDLGATCHRGLLLTPCVVVSPSSFIWDTTLSLMGLLSLVSAVLFYGATRKKGFSILFGIWGLGALIAGAVPENLLLSVHELASLAAFLGGGIAAIVAFWFL